MVVLNFLNTTVQIDYYGGVFGLYSTVLTRKGQTTIPVEIRQRFGLAEGDSLDWFFKKNVIELVPRKKFKNPLKVLSGCLKTKDSYADFKRKALAAETESLK